MPTECERSVTSPVPNTDIKENSNGNNNLNEDLAAHSMMDNSDMSTSQTSTTSNGSSICNGGRKTSITSPDPTAYVAKARVTRPTPPPPPYNPMQFVQIKPCNLYQTAQEQLKKAEEVKKIKEIRKEEPEDWQNNLDNWKSSRRKRVEHIIDRVVEVKKLELEEHDRTRRKSKTFSEMIEERGERSGGRGLNKLASLAVYAEDEANDLSDLGIGTSSASGKSSLSEDYDNNSVMSDNAAELDKAINNSTHHKPATTESTTREYISSPGYETSSSTAPASSPDPCEYTYEGAIQDYKQRVSRAASGLTSVALNKLSSRQQQNSKESTPEKPFNKETAYPPRRGSKIEDRLMGFEVQSPSEECIEKNKVDVPKIDISKRKEIFESQEIQNTEPKSQLLGNSSAAPRVTLRDRFKVQEANSEILTEQPKKQQKRLSGDITSIKERLQSLEQQHNLVNGANGATKITANNIVDIPVPPLKERLSSLQNAVTKEEIRKPPVVLVDARQLEIMKCEEEKAQLTLKESKKEIEAVTEKTKSLDNFTDNQPTKSMYQELEEIDRNDSGIHTADDVELEERVQADLMKKEQELKLNAAIEALAKEEQQLSEAANAVNQIEAEFEELTLGSVSLPPLATNSNACTTPITNDHMEYSVSFTNPQTKSTLSSNNISSNSHNDKTSSSSSGIGSISSVENVNTVKGLDFKTASNLRRKPTNEMVHAKNLLKIFNETFQNDNELNERKVNEELETKSNKEVLTRNNKLDLSLNVKSQIYENSKNSLPTAREETKEINSPDNLVVSTLQTLATTPAGSPNRSAFNIPSTFKTASSIPRSITPLGKPPMSPQSIRSTTKFLAATPPGSPSFARKNESQFSINGRVEIFNSKTLTSSPNAGGMKKPTTPTMTTKKTQLAYINAPKTNQSNNTVLPIQHNQQQQQQQQELPQDETTNQRQKQKSTTTVIEPLSTTSATVTTKQDEKNKQLKSMPSQQMVNEPQKLKLDDREINHHYRQQQPANHNNNSVKQQQQQQPEVIVCAPPITIVNPDELPKPNTVKNLSSCFQQQSTVAKPLLRSRIPQVTPPPSPVLPRRHICYTSENDKVDNGKHSYTDSEAEKKLSIISSSSTSSTSTGCTVIDNNKKLSILSNTSSTSEDITPTIVQTTAQVHKEPAKERHTANTEKSEVLKLVNEKPNDKLENQQIVEDVMEKQTQDSKDNMVKPKKQAKTLDKHSTKALMEEVIKTDKQNRTLVLNTKEVNSKTNETKPIASFKMNSEKAIAENSTPCVLPLAPLKSPKTELCSSSLARDGQGTCLEPLKSTKSSDCTSTIIIPAELPALPECSPNHSTLYKLASSAPHSPTSPAANSEKNLAIDSDLCNSLLTSLAATPHVLQRQHTIEEDQCQKVDKDTLPFHQGSTGYKDITKTDIKQCEGISPTTAPKLQNFYPEPQKFMEEELCQKLDIQSLPDGKQQPTTGYKCIFPTEIRKCDNIFLFGSEKPRSKSNSKPNAPIVQAREAHSKALIETCEKIIAEERMASTQIKSSLPSTTTPLGTPIMQRKSKIPKPIVACCKATESLNEADCKTNSPKEDNNAVIARMHVVETQIKVTTTTPPSSPKVETKPPPASPHPNKKTKNIFDFLKKNFGVGGHSHKEDSPEQKQLPAASTENKVLVLSLEELKDLEKVNYDEIHTFDNSKFYVPTKELDNEDEAANPPPLPKTPAPVNIEITRKVITNEILEDGKTEKDLTKEIDELLDDELNKLNHEIEELEKSGKKL